MSTTVKPISLSDFYAMFRNLLRSAHDGQGMDSLSFLGHLLPGRMKTTISISFVFMVAGAAFAGEWQRNTFPGQGFVDNGFAPGAGWSHMENPMDVSVSPLDKNFRAVLENEWTAVYTEDGLNYKPLRMPHIGSPGCSAQSVEFSRYAANTMYLRVAHNYWKSINPSKSPAGLWRSTDRGQTWQHLYQPPAGGYEYNSGSNAGRTRMMEDPSPQRSNHLYFGTTSEGLQRSKDNGATWETAVPELANRRIKTVMAVAAANNETILYTIVEKKMPRHIAGKPVPLHFNSAPSDYDAQWPLERNLNDASGKGKHLSGSVSSWTDSCMEKSHAAVFNGNTSLNSANLVYSGTQSLLSVSAWVQTSSSANQSIISYDRNKFWELGTRNGRVTWAVRDSGGAVHEIEGSLVNDGDWHHVGAVFDDGSMRLYVDGEEVAQGSAGTKQLGSGNAVAGVVGAGFTGRLDDVRIYNSRALNLVAAQQLYLEENNKNPIAQGQLWRIRVNAAGEIAEAKRLHAPLADFHDVEVDPKDASKGWVIRKAIPIGWPYGGRELYKFSNFGDTMTSSTAALGANQTFDVVMVNPDDTNHVFLVCSGPANSGLRWSRNGGGAWDGLNRKVGDFIPSIKSWMPMDYETYQTGVKADTSFEILGSQFSFVPGDKNKLLWINQKGGGLMESADYGATWRTNATGGPNKDVCQIAIAHSNPDRWSVALFEHGWSVTTNNGLSWYAETTKNNALLESLAKQAEAAGTWWTAARVPGGVAFHSTNPDIMVATWSTKGYILRSTDAGLSWSNTGFRNPMDQWVDVFWSRTDARRVYAGRLRSDDAGVTWNTDINKVVIAVCDSNSDILVGVDNVQNDVTALSLNMYFSTNGGNSWTSLPDPPRETVPGTNNQWLVTGTGRKWHTMADALVAIDPGASSLRILLAGRSGIYEYNAGNNVWTLNKAGLKNNRHLNLTEQVPWMGFVAFDPRPGFSHIVYAASQNDDRTQGAWAGEGNPNRAYPGGENSDPYYRSTDGGITWEHLHGVNHPDAPGGGQIESMTVDMRGRMFAATTEGVYIYTDQTPTLTPRGTIIASVTAPTGGGNRNIEIIRDGVKPAVGSTDSSLQYDTYNGSGGPLEEYIGYTFESAPTFTKVIFQEGKHFPGGGWWANGSVVVQVRQGGTWNTVSATVSPAYPSGNTQAAFGSSFETYTFTLAALTTGDGIRLSGTAGGGSAPFISVGELEVIGNHPPVFALDPVVNANATEDAAYTGSITGSASDVDAVASLSYSKTSGPGWLGVAANGALSGTPGNGDVGLNSFTVEVSDGNGGTDSATLEITVVNVNHAPVFMSGLSVDFTNGTYPNGRLDSNVGWNGDGANWVVTEPLGLVANDTAADWKLQHTTAVNATGITVGAVLRFSESGAAPATDWRTLLEIGLTGSEDLGLKLVRRTGTASEYQLVFTKGADAVGGFNSGKVDGSRLGLNLAGGDANSDRLYLTYKITRGALAANTWTATTKLYNLDTDPGMNSAIIGQNNLAVDPADVLWGEGLYPYMNSVQNNASGKITGLTIESFTATPEPALSSAPIVRASAIEGSAYLESLVGSASDPDPADTLTFAKISGPAWLSVAGNGVLSGTPGNGDVGLNSFTVEVSDGNGGTDSATLEITVAAQPLDSYALWASAKKVGAMADDPDHDGLSNLAEYALGGNPANANDAGLLPDHVKTNDGWHYVYRRHLDPAAAGLVYTVETTTNLASGDWTDTGTVEIDSEVIDSEFESVINAVDTTDKPALFIRLKIEAR